MTTELMPIWSIEIGDTLLINGDIYAVVDADYSEEDDDYHMITLVDEEGNRKRFSAPSNKEVRIIVSEFV